MFKQLFLLYRYTWKPQEKAVYAFLLSWPSKGFVILSGPVVSEAKTQVTVFAALLHISSFYVEHSEHG